MEGFENSQTAQHLWNIGQTLSSTCPAASRYYIFNFQRKIISDPTLQTSNSKKHKFCEHCGTLWSSENHRVRIQPAPSKNQHIKKLLKLEVKEPWKLNNRQKKKLKKFRDATSKIVYSCFTCKKTVKFTGLKRKNQNFTKRTSLYTLPLNLKPKKKDVNAGLFISSPLATAKINENENSQNQLEVTDNLHSAESNSGGVSEIEKSNISANPITDSKPNSIAELNLPKRKYCLVQTTDKKTNSQNQKRKKKSLLEQIMKQEQEALQKKTTLSSFLVSL